MATSPHPWPLRWDLLLRYRLIEVISLWEGRLTTNHLTRAFGLGLGLGRKQASKQASIKGHQHLLRRACTRQSCLRQAAEGLPAYGPVHTGIHPWPGR